MSIIISTFLSLSLGVESPDRLTFDEVKVYSVSTKIEQLNYNPKGSVAGGTYLYLKVVGID